jgi:4a-hydroxytetrahydrobiopterin dehydratase
MDNRQLVKGHCVPCEGGVEPMKKEEAKTYLSLLKKSWKISADLKSISLRFEFKNFLEAIDFVNKVAPIAEEQGHHPDIYIYYNKVDITLTTHAIKGLSVNDFLVAAKVELL